MAKRPADDDAAASDMEAGMTTAERRRRRRRGGGIRVPSDNVPRSRPATAPPPPRPEDPALAMSIAYSFTNDASGPVPRTPIERDRDGHDASEATLSDPQSNGESTDFETKTREMTAVDLEALGLADSAPGNAIPRPVSSPGLPTFIERAASPLPTPLRDEDVDVVIDAGDTLEQPEIADSSRRAARQSDVPDAVVRDVPAVPAPNGDHARLRSDSRRLQTVALSEEDLEEVRASTSPVVVRSKPASSPPPLKPSTKPPPMATPNPSTRMASGEVRVVAATPPHPTPVAETPSTKTQQLQAVDIEVIAQATPSESISAAEIDLSELAIRAESSGEIDVDVAVEESNSEPPLPPQLPALAKAPDPIAPPAVGTNPGAQPEAAVKQPRAATAPPAPPAASATERKSGAIELHPPPPPPPVAKIPPTPPQAFKKPPIADKSSPSRGKPWFVDLFDEDYLRTLPFLTPQATQAEAEFVIDTLGLAPGAQVLDVGCGYGRHAMELAARGFHVVGLDMSTPLLLRGGEEASRRGLTINFIRGDMRELDFENQFDAAYSLFSTFGYFDDETNKKTLQNIARALKPNGKVLIEILNRDYVIADLPTRVWWEGDGCVVLEEVELNYFSSRIQVNRSVVFDDGRQLEQEISVRAY
ncbi:MAG TPA: methyltransferase domain-containing protein, partial [Kofleriaceae bacterium]|nr:methyltransferase domain-containing protein [Kofleriaceae bacterium]